MAQTTANLALRKRRAEGIAEGRAEGIEEGRAEERAKVVLNMRSMGLSDEMIAQATGLTIEEIRHTDKVLFELSDGNRVETVGLFYKEGWNALIFFSQISS